MKIFGIAAGLIWGPLWVLAFGSLQIWGIIGWSLVLGFPLLCTLIAWLYKPVQTAFFKLFSISWLIGSAAFLFYIVATFIVKLT